jgi:hypothetical protein
VSIGLYTTTEISISCEEFKSDHTNDKFRLLKSDSIYLTKLLNANVDKKYQLKQLWEPDVRCIVNLGNNEYFISSTLIKFNHNTYDLTDMLRDFLEVMYERSILPKSNNKNRRKGSQSLKNSRIKKNNSKEKNKSSY